MSKRGCYMFRMRAGWGEKGTDIRKFNLNNVAAKVAAFPKEKKLVFLNDMSDTFGEFFTDMEIKATHVIVIEANPDRDFQLLTKRIGRAMLFYRKYYNGRPPRNVWMGCSIGERSRLKRLDQLRQIDAKVRFVSFEPLIEDLGDFDLKGIDWAIVGGESGSEPRPMDPAWAENLRRICERDGVAFFFKQMGGKGGDGAGGSLLNGVQYRNFPRTDNRV